MNRTRPEIGTLRDAFAKDVSLVAEPEQRIECVAIPRIGIDERPAGGAGPTVDPVGALLEIRREIPEPAPVGKASTVARDVGRRRRRGGVPSAVPVPRLPRLARDVRL